jgi:hypothetical protein
MQVGWGAEHRGVVKFGGSPLPGASVTLRQPAKTLTAISDTDGRYSFEIEASPFQVTVEMPLFLPQERGFAVLENAEWNLELAPKEIRRATIAAPKTGIPVPPRKEAPKRDEKGEAAPAPPDVDQRAADGLLIQGSVNNALNSPFSQLPAFGNNRRGQRSLYNGNLGVILNNAIFDARAYSLTGQSTPKPAYSRVQGVFAFGGPLKIPRVLNARSAPNFTINYQGTRNRNASTQTALMPAELERAGVLGSLVRDPVTNQPFPNQTIPASRVSPQARALLELYPLPNFASSSRYNFQLPIVSGLHQDDLQSRVTKQSGRNAYNGSFAWQSTRTDTPDLFGLLDTGRVRGWNTTLGYRRTLTPRSFVNTAFNFSRLTTRVTPYFSQRENFSARAGIGGNNQEAVNWGAPNLFFANGIQALIMAQASLLRNQTSGFLVDYFVNRRNHNVQAGLNLRWQQFNVLAQQDARGTFNFTGAATGNDFAGFLLGIPDTSSIAFGNADKYLRGRISEVFLNDDWRVNPSFTINAGLRWEYWTPLREKYGRLVNLAIGPNYATASPSSTLPAADRNNLAPRFGFSWRPVAASSMVVRGGYGIYYDTSVYQPIAMEMAQQAPLSRSLRVSNSPATPLSLANGFPAAGATSATTFAVDPLFRIGYAQAWQLSVQRDLPAALQVTAAYSGSKGTRAQQQFLPNTFPEAAIDPAGYTFLTSNGNSIRHAGQLQLRRRLRRGFTAQVQYTWAKSIDNALLDGRGRPMIAQNWVDLSAERGRSNFDQRQLVSTMAQYTSGAGLRGRWAPWLRDWNFASQMTWGTGLPLTPVIARATPGTGVTGSLRPDFTGQDLYHAPAGFNLNRAAVAAPARGNWGNAGRNSITGPRQFVVNASVGRMFRATDRVSFDARIDIANATNTPVFPSWNTTLDNAQFGLPNAVNPMRNAQITFRMRF